MFCLPLDVFYQLPNLEERPQEKITEAGYFIEDHLVYGRVRNNETGEFYNVGDYSAQNDSDNIILTKREFLDRLYRCDGTLCYEGPIDKEGRRQGQGKEYDASGKNVVFIGMYKDNKRDGTGRVIDVEKSISYLGVWEKWQTL